MPLDQKKEDLFNLLRWVLTKNTRDCKKLFLVATHENQAKGLKALILVAYASQVSNEGVMMKSPPGDIDIIMRFVYHAMNSDTGTFIDNDTHQKRKVLDINSCWLPAEQRSAVIGLHSFSEHNKLSSFFRNEEPTCSKKTCKIADHISTFSLFGSICYVDLELTEHIEKYVFC